MTKDIKPDRDGRFDANQMFGVDGKRAQQIFKLFEHAQIDIDNWCGIWDFVKEEISGESEMAYAGYVFARLYILHEGKHKDHDHLDDDSDMPEFLKELLKHATVVGHGHIHKH